MVQRNIWINIGLKIVKTKSKFNSIDCFCNNIFYYCKNTFLHKYCFAWNIFLIKWIFFHLFCTCNIFCNILHFICCKKTKTSKTSFSSRSFPPKSSLSSKSKSRKPQTVTLTDGQTNEFETKIIFSFTNNIKFGICLINSFLHVDWDDQ